MSLLVDTGERLVKSHIPLLRRSLFPATRWCGTQLSSDNESRNWKPHSELKKIKKKGCSRMQGKPVKFRFHTQ